MQVCRSTCIACIIGTSMIKSITRGVSRKCTRGMLKYWRMCKILTMLPRIPDQIVTREDSVACYLALLKTILLSCYSSSKRRLA